MENTVVAFPRGNKKQKGELFWCFECRCYVPNYNIHVVGKQHIRRIVVNEIVPTMKLHGIDWEDETKRKMFYTDCEVYVPVAKENLEAHARAHDPISIKEPMEKVGLFAHGVPATIHRVIQTVRPKKYWAQYNVATEYSKHKEFCTPSSLQDPSGEIAFFTGDIFSKQELKAMTTTVKWLETNGGNTTRGVRKQSSRMITCGLRCKYGKMAWYFHKNPECYRRSEELVHMVNVGLKHKFQPIISHLYQISANEGIGPDEGCMGNSPFTGISITKDYNCVTHTDTNDFSYSFFVWLGKDGTIVNGNGVRFHLPDVGAYCVPKVGDVLVMKSSMINHCTQSTGGIGQYGLNVYMQASMFPMWRVLRADMKAKEEGAVLSEKKNQFVDHWIVNNKLYQDSIRNS